MLREQDNRLTALHEAFHGRVLAFVRRRVSSEETARELAADVFRVAWQKADEVPDPALGWLLAVARNLIGNEYRGRARARQLEARLAESLRTQSQTHASAEQALVVAALSRLREKDREVLMLSYWEGLSLAEIGQVLGCTGSNAGVRLHRARKAFARALPAHLRPESED